MREKSQLLLLFFFLRNFLCFSVGKTRNQKHREINTHKQKNKTGHVQGLEAHEIKAAHHITEIEIETVIENEIGIEIGTEKEKKTKVKIEILNMQTQ